MEKKEEFTGLIQNYKNEMFLLAMSLCRNYHDAEDAVSEAVLKAYEKYDSLRNPASAKFWLMRILANQCRILLRGRKRMICTDQVEEFFSGCVHPDSGLWETVAAMEEELRTVVILYYYDGFTVKETAKIMKIPEGTVKSRLARAREKLGDML